MSRRVSFAMSACGFAMLLAGSAANLRAEERPVLVGILRADGILFPFAEYSEHAWKRTWATGDVSGRPKLSSRLKSEGSQALTYRGVEVGQSLPLSQVPREWTGYPSEMFSLWYLSSAGRQNMPLHILRAVVSQTHCELAWGLDTDFPKQPVPSDTFPIHKAGIALTSPRDFAAMESIGAESKSFAWISTAVQSIFDPLDREASRNYDDAASSSGVSVTTIVGSTSVVEGRAWYYFEAKRSYKKKPQSADAGCEHISFLTGWFEAAPSGRLKPLGKKFYPTDCDMQSVRTEIPFGILRLDRRIYLLSQEIGYEDESYRIWVIDAQGLQPVLEAPGGGC